MLTCANAEFLCNALYKNLLDSYNNKEPRKNIISMFEKRFSHVWFTNYDDVIVAEEILGEAIFISQEGIYRYMDLTEGKYIDITTYMENEYFSLAIVTDLYSVKGDTSYIPESSRYSLEPMLDFNDNDKSSLRLIDNIFSEEFLTKLYKSLSSYHSIIKIVKRLYENIL